MQIPTLDTTETIRIAGLLGLGEAVRDRVALADRVARGLPARSADHLHAALGGKAFFQILPEATYRRVRRKGDPLTRETSEKLYEFGRVFELATRLYGGDTERAMRFLETGHAMLGGRSPLSLATSSSAGADAVVDLLHRAEASFAA
jgi:putative toxin-antitoxin system antitoxin component (TIGR02293 family)